MASDYRVPWATYGANNADVQLPTIAVFLVTAQSTKCTVHVQRIVFTPATFTGATLSFVDSISGKVVGTIVVPPTAATGNPAPLDFGAQGIALCKGAHLLLGGSANGHLHVDAYQTPTRQNR